MGWAAIGQALLKAAPYVTTGLQIVSGATSNRKNRQSQRDQNEADREFTREMYNTQRQHALEDWHRQNEYNAPQQQMQRLKEAGLNPNLVYGKGADNTAGVIARSTPSHNNQPAPQYKDSLGPGLEVGLNTLSQYQQVKQSQAQTDNLNKQAALISADTALRESQAETEKSRKVGQDLQNIQYGKQNNLLDFDYNQKLKLSDINIKSAELDNALKDQALSLNLSKHELDKLNSATNRGLVFQQMLETKERRLYQEIQNDIARNTKAEVIEMKKLELKKLQESLEHMKKEGLLLDQKVRDRLIDHTIKVNTARHLEADTDYIKTKDKWHWLEVGGKFFKVPNVTNVYKNK